MEEAEKFVKKSKRVLCHTARIWEYSLPHNVPRLNLHADSNSEAAEDVLEQLLTSVRRKGSSYVSTYPVPVGPPATVDDSVVKGLDPVLKIIRDQQRFKATFEKVKRSKKFKALKLEDIETSSKIAETEPEVAVHPCILELAQVCSSDPNPNFSCDYNYYYGSNVAVTELQGRVVIAHSQQHEPSKLSFVVPKFDEEPKYDVSHLTHQMKNGAIYQVDCSSNLILLRQKKSCGLFKFSLDDGGSLQKLGVVTTPDVFINSCLNEFNQDEFATVSLNSALEIHDVLGKSKRSVEVEGVKDNWGHVHYHDRNVLMFTDRDSISLCDLRDSRSESLRWEFKDQTEMCDDAFAAAKGKFLHYVSTKHYLLSLDIRKGFHQRWSHGLISAPCLLNVVSKENQNDALLIGCQSSGGIVYVQSSPFGDFTSDILVPPFRLPSLRETLHVSRTKGCLLSPIISSRFSLSLTGLTSFKHSEKTHIFSCNSIGDLFAQSISSANRDALVEPLSMSDLERLSSWESECLQQFHGINHGFKATGVSSLPNLADVFEDRCDTIDEPSASQNSMCELSDEPSTSQNAKTAQKWNKSKKLLLSFQDVLAPKLLAHWNIEEDDEWCDVDETINEDNVKSEESSDDQDVETKVKAWLDKSVNKSGLETAEYW